MIESVRITYFYQSLFYNCNILFFYSNAANLIYSFILVILNTQQTRNYLIMNEILCIFKAKQFFTQIFILGFCHIGDKHKQ